MEVKHLKKWLIEGSVIFEKTELYYINSGISRMKKKLVLVGSEFVCEKEISELYHG